MPSLYYIRNLFVIGSNPIRSKFSLIRGLFLFFISFYKAAFLSFSPYCLRSAASPLFSFVGSCEKFNAHLALVWLAKSQKTVF